MKSRYFINVLTLFMLLFGSGKLSVAQHSKSLHNQSMDQSMHTDIYGPQNGNVIELYDRQMGIVSSRLIFPKGWKEIRDKEYKYAGPNGLKISHMGVSQTYSFIRDRYQAQSYEAMGYQNIYPMTLDQIIQEFIMPVAGPRGLRLINTFTLPKHARKMYNFSQLVYRQGITSMNIDSYGLEWTDNAGKKYLTIISILVSEGNLSSFWSFNSQYIESPSHLYEKAKRTFIDVVLSEQHNTEWLTRKNREVARNLRIQYEADQARYNAILLRNRKSAFSSNSSSLAKTYSDILDINHSGYLSRDKQNSAGHSKTIDMIREQNLIYNSYTNESYYVPSGSDFYWVNKDAGFIGTNNANFDPRVNSRINHMEWMPFRVQG